MSPTEHRPSRTLRGALRAAFLLLPILVARPAGAMPGDLDGTFAGFRFSGYTAADEDMAVTPDGRIVTVATSGVQILVRRYLADGTPDSSFDGDGTAALLNTSYAMRARAVAVQSDGRIVVAGSADRATEDFLVVRVLGSGAVDSSFGNAGYVAVHRWQDERAEAVLIQPDGRIVVSGTWFYVFRFHPNGALDSTFGTGGVAEVQFNSNTSACFDLIQQPDGKIVAAGTTFEDDFFGATFNLGVARLNADGTLDGSFHSDGMASAALGGDDRAHGVGVQADGRIVVAGTRDGSDGVMARFLANGNLDLSLDGDGKLSVPGCGPISDLAIQPDGGIVLVGGGGLATEIHRLRMDGSLDPTFDGDGVVTGWLGPGRSTALLPDGRILVLGASALARLWPDGALDLGGRQAFAFDENGIPAGAGFPPGSAEIANDMAIQTDGKIVLVGTVVHPVSGESDVALARFTPEGRLDETFGTHGHVTFSFHNQDVANAVAIQPDGRIVIAGFTGTGFNINFLVARFLPSGALDNTFGFGGFNLVNFGGWDDYAHALAVAPDGKIVVAGAVFDGSHYVFGVARFTSEGVADPSFDGDARQIVDFGPGLHHDGRAMIVQPDGKIVVAGGVGLDFGITRLNADGSLDDTFGCQGGVGGGGGSCSGRARIDMGGDDYLHAIARAPNGWLYAAGYSAAGAVRPAIAQFDGNGRLHSCPPFPCAGWPQGKAYLDWGSVGAAYAMDVRGDGQIVVAGEADGVLTWAQFDPGSTTPVVTSSADFPGPRDYAEAVRFTGSNRLILGGRMIFNGDESMALARFETTGNPTVDVPAAQGTDGGALGALAPNPSRTGTSLTFALARSSTVELRIHDVAGRLVRTIDAGTLPEGRHRLTWDGRDEDGVPVRAGVFFVCLRSAGRQVGSRSVVIHR